MIFGEWGLIGLVGEDATNTQAEALINVILRVDAARIVVQEVGISLATRRTGPEVAGRALSVLGGDAPMPVAVVLSKAERLC